MDKFSVQDEGIKRASGLKALLLEIGVIVVLIVVAIFILGYFNIIDLSSFFPKQKVEVATDLAGISKITKTPVNPTNTKRFIDQTDQAITSAQTINQYQGVITFITTKEGVEEGQGNIRYKAKIILQGKGKNPSTILFTDKALSVAKVVEIKDNKEVPLSISDLKLDDKLKIVVTRSLDFATASYDYTEVEIERTVQ